MNKLNPKITFKFETQEDFLDINYNIDFKIINKINNIKIKKFKKRKKDASTGRLF